MLATQTADLSSRNEPSDAAVEPSTPLAHKAYRMLRDNIIAGVYAPGSRLSARRIVEQTGLGATPVREACARLQLEGLLHILPRSGYVVAALTRKSVTDFYEIWRLIGPTIVRLGVENRTGAQLRRLEEIADSVIALLPRLADGSELTAWIRLAEERFAVLAQASGNPHLIAINDRLSLEKERIYTFHMRSGAHRDGGQFFGMDRERVLRTVELARQRRGVAAEDSARTAIDRTHQSMLRLFWPDAESAG